MRVVEHEGDVGQGGEAKRRGHGAGRVAEGREPPEARLQGEPEAEHEEDGESDQPAHEPDRVDDVEAVHPSPF